jgi:hypothetical protein
LVNKFSFEGTPKQVLKTESQKYGIAEYGLSKPQSFLRMQDFGWNPVLQIFNVKEVPKEIKNVLQKAGFK